MDPAARFRRFGLEGASQPDRDRRADERAWAVLTDFTAFPDWNPFMIAASGDLRPGGRLEVTLRPPGRKAFTFRPTVKELEPARRLRWLGRTGLPGIFDGEHVHEMTALGPNRTRYVQRERFRGVLTPFLRRMLDDTKGGFDAMNAALKARAEEPDAG